MMRTTVIRGTKAADATDAVRTNVIDKFDPRTVHVVMNAAEANEAARLAAIDAGHAEGLENARREVAAAMDDSNKRVRRALAALCNAVDGFDNRQAISLLEVEDQIVAGAFELARSILGRELAVATDPGAEAIARAMKLIPNRGDVLVHLNPQDAETLSMDHISTTTRTVQVVADPAIEVGGCIAEVGETRVDSQFSNVLINVGKALGLEASSIVSFQERAAGSSLSLSRTTASEAPLS